MALDAEKLRGIQDAVSGLKARMDVGIADADFDLAAAQKRAQELRAGIYDRSVASYGPYVKARAKIEAAQVEYNRVRDQARKEAEAMEKELASLKRKAAKYGRV